MPFLVVGGQARKIGKTTLIASLISRFPQLSWTAVKITSHQHEPKNCVQIANCKGWSVWKQTTSQESSDTARYLQAGARTALLVKAEDDALPHVAKFLKNGFAKENVVIESSRIADILHPECFVMILKSGSANAKHLAPERLFRADAFISADWQIPVISKLGLDAKPIFRSSESGSMGDEFWDFISTRFDIER